MQSIPNLSEYPCDIFLIFWSAENIFWFFSAWDVKHGDLLFPYRCKMYAVMQYVYMYMCHKQLIFKLAPERSIDEYSILHHGDLEFLYRRKMYVAMHYVKPPRLMFVYMCHQHGKRMTIITPNYE